MIISTFDKLIEIEALVMGIDVIRPRDFYFPGESHDFWEAVFVTSGNATATADERIYNLTPGMLLFHKPREFHRIWSNGDTAPHLMLLSFKAHGDGMEHFENACFKLPPDKWPKISEIMTYMPLHNERGSLTGRDNLSLNRGAVKLTELLLDLIGMGEYHQTVDNADEIRYANIVSVMKNNLDKMLTVEEIADLCGLGTSNMKRIFAKFSGVGAAKYFLSLKMWKAMEMLDGGMKSGEVAERLGFSEIAYFYTAFKRECGMTPREYIKNKKT